jgi:dTDP-4-amino-4,6-dideoxygalactose transaminase
MGGLEGASLSVKLKYLEGWNNRRRAIAKRYQTEITNPKIKMQSKPDWSDGIYHLFVVTTENKEAFVKHLDENGIVAAYHYPVPCHLQKAYAHLGYKQGDFPHAEYLAAHCVSLPMYAELSDEDVNKVIATINKY